MTKQFIVVLALLSSLAVIGGCGAGGSSAPSTPGDISGSPATDGPATPFQTGSGTAALDWDAPTTNVDGTPLTDLAGYRIHIGASSGTYTSSINVGNVTAYSMNNLVPGTYYFVVTAYNTNGIESSYSNEADKTIL